MSPTNGHAADAGAVGDAADYAIRVLRSHAGFTATLRGDVGPLATGVAATAGEAMLAAIADARIPDAPERPRSADEYDPPTL